MKELHLVIHRVNKNEDMETCAGIMAASEPWITLGITLDRLRITLRNPLNEVYATRVEDEIVGTMVVQTRGAFSGYLKSFAVKDGFRGREVGEQMMAFLEKKIFTTSTNLFLCVSSFNTGAQRFYRKLGYKKVGVLENYLVEGQDEILMRKSIGPILD